MLWDRDPLGGGPGGGGGNGMPGPQPPLGGVGEFSIGVRALLLASPIAPVEAARRDAGALAGESGLYRRSGAAFGRNLDQH